MLQALALETYSRTYSIWGATLTAPSLMVAKGEVVALAAICASSSRLGSLCGTGHQSVASEQRQSSAQQPLQSPEGKARGVEMPDAEAA